MKIYYAGSIALGALLSLVPPVAAQSAVACPVKIGITLPLSGSLASVAKATSESANLAVEHVNAGGGVKGCPASHPVPVPSLSLNFRYKISGPLGGVSLASGGVYSGHADFFNSWNQNVLAQLVKDCLNAGRTCVSTISDAPR